jgi:hypothetical protein
MEGEKTAVIDTIKVKTDRFRVKEVKGLKSKSIMDIRTNEIEKEVFFWDMKEVGLKYSRNVNIEIKRGYLSVSFSLPKLLNNGINIESADVNGFIEGLKKVEILLEKLGIEHTDIRNFLISRLDIAGNIETEYDFDMYQDIFKMMSVSRTTKRDYGSTYTIGNKQWEICFYGKMKEIRKNLKSKGKKKELLEIEERYSQKNIFRGEVRFFRDYCKKEGLNTVSDVIKNYNNLGRVFMKFLVERIFKTESDFFIKSEQKDEYALFLSMLSRARKARQLSKETYGFIAYIMVQINFMDVEYVANILGKSRITKYRIKRELRKELGRLSANKNIEFFRKYKELRDKFFAVASRFSSGSSKTLEQTKSVAISKK